jgi:magnesium/cobalt transport protein CorA
MSIKARLYDAEGNDREVDFSHEYVETLDQNKLLWLDLSPEDSEGMENVIAEFALPRGIRDNLRDTGRRPRLETYDNTIHLRVNAVRESGSSVRPEPLDFILGENLVITLHAQPVAFLESFERRKLGETEMGKLDAPEFLASLLDWHVTSYFRMVEEISEQIDKLDERVLRSRGTGDILSEMVDLRRKVARIRRILAPHREVYTALSNPDVPMIGNSDSAKQFQALYDRLERAIESVENARELLLGSFELHDALVGQKTNDIMKVLTLATVSLLPIGAVAGIMGMNFKAKLFETDDAGFWITVAVMVAISIGTVLYARFRRLI